MTDSEISVRRCALADVARIEATEPPGKRYARTAFERQRTGRGTYLVAWRGLAPVGSGELISGDRLELQNLHVRPDFRGGGVGSAIIAAAEALAAAHGMLHIGVSDDNDRARDLYLRRGYRPTAELETYTYSYVDDDGVEHTVTETAEFLAKSL